MAKKPTPGMTGSGLAAKAGTILQDRSKDLDAKMQSILYGVNNPPKKKK